MVSGSKFVDATTTSFATGKWFERTRTGKSLRRRRDAADAALLYMRHQLREATEVARTPLARRSVGSFHLNLNLRRENHSVLRLGVLACVPFYVGDIFSFDDGVRSFA